MTIDYHIFKSAANNYLSRYVGGDKRPTFFEIDEICPDLNDLTRAYSVIRQEFDATIQQKAALPEYHDIDPGEAKISNTTARKWNVFMLYLLGHKPEKNRALCPQTCKLLNKIPHLVQAFFSVMEPGKSVPLHEGPYLGYLRYHLGLKVPKNNPPHIVVNQQPYTWKEGEAVMFDDSWPHEVVNDSDEERAVLIVDVLRPLPTLPNTFNRFLTNCIARHTYGRSVMKRLAAY